MNCNNFWKEKNSRTLSKNKSYRTKIFNSMNCNNNISNSKNKTKKENYREKIK